MAIDFKELRFGNIVHYEGTEPEYGDEEDVVIGSISEGELMGYAYSCYHGIDCQRCYHINNPSFFSPIDLTEEWLVKFGLRSNNANNNICFVKYSGEINFEVEKVNDGYSLAVESFEYLVGKPFQFVHQLQNLYYFLAGDELQIKEA